MEIKVRNGDTYWYYSQLFGIPLILIENSNPEISPEELAVGQIVQIPGYRKTSYTISADDSFWTISLTNNVSVDSLLLLNPNVDTQNLQIGDTVFLPTKVSELIIKDVNNYTYEKMVTDLNELHDIYPFIKKQSIGNSVMGKDLIELQIGNGTKQVHLNGAFHANEWITVSVIMRFINEYVLSLTTHEPIRGIFTLPLYMETTLSIVPMVNPDGVNLVLQGSSAAGEFEEEVLVINNQQKDFSNWKANIRGVDLNNQYPALWETEAERKPTTPQPRDFPGYEPLTEPESIAMAELAKNRNFSILNAFHTQGEEIYWGFQGMEPPISEQIVEEYARVSGYVPIRYIDSYAGYKDWFIQEFRQPGYTIELGRGVNPLPIGQFPEIYQRSLGIMLASLYL
ncbi:M14 family metallopeptidase [Virgibacillus sp. SK37]|uniref:M14 family metallopeptidase n=1 Tax=Virgibacillus sp. SK37 TaxID=403957 RepID=UPI0004D0DB31|nr:M14 family metallopeptidase [Virgibacillus sp. SK37]AIF43628.1 peptidase M14 [Virgibacillus sp. SK37]